VEDHRLVELARAARERAYARYSDYPVGAALLTSSGKVYTGCNVENAAYGLTICAERTAVVKAVSEGDRQFQAIAVFSRNGAAPCGSCRQVLAEFAPDIRVLVADASGHYDVYCLSDLLPQHFGPSKLDREGAGNLTG
jgi:cytidine deaminase